MPFAFRCLLLAAVLTTGCTYGTPEDHVNVQNVALRPDGTRIAVIVRYRRTRPPTGLSAFPDGGVARVLAQRADLYVVDLRSRTLAYRGEVPAPPDHSVSFSPWLMGWEGDTVYFKITGCPGSPGAECYGPLVRTSVYALSATGQLARARSLPTPVLVSTRSDASEHVSVGVEPYGVSVGMRLGAPRTPLMTFVGERLELVPRCAAGPSVDRSSGNAIYDQSALSAVMEASPPRRSRPSSEDLA
jgi:hypothetical protein